MTGFTILEFVTSLPIIGLFIISSTNLNYSAQSRVSLKDSEQGKFIETTDILTKPGVVLSLVGVSYYICACVLFLGITYIKLSRKCVVLVTIGIQSPHTTPYSMVIIIICTALFLADDTPLKLF